MSGYIFLYKLVPLEWGSKKQDYMAFFTFEAKDISLCMATKEVVWLRDLLGFLGAVQHTSIVIYQDNRLTIALVESGQILCKTKHIEFFFHYRRDKIVDNTIELKYCPTHKMIANGLTKALTPKLFVQLRDKFMAPKSIADTLSRSVCTKTR